MLNDIIILDDVIPKVRQLEIEAMCTHQMFPWSFIGGSVTQEDIDGYQLRITPNTLNVPQMFSVLYRDNEESSPYFLALIPVISALPVTIGQLLRVKLNLTLPAAGATPLTYGTPHCDVPNVPNNVTAIYYINDSDGETVIFNEHFNHNGPLTEKARIKPKQGRLVVFDGCLMHAGNYPTTNNPRLIANINFIPYSK
jgi:hypothetical protein